MVPVAVQVRVNVSLKLTRTSFTPDLKDKASEAYKSLKTEVVETVINIDLKYLIIKQIS